MKRPFSGPIAGRRARPDAAARSGTLPAVPTQRPGALRRYGRLVAQRLAVVAALLILYYATSLHGLSARTFVLAGVLILCLYWLFKGAL